MPTDPGHRQLSRRGVADREPVEPHRPVRIDLADHADRVDGHDAPSVASAGVVGWVCLGRRDNLDGPNTATTTTAATTVNPAISQNGRTQFSIPRGRSTSVRGALVAVWNRITRSRLPLLTTTPSPAGNERFGVDRSGSVKPGDRRPNVRRHQHRQVIHQQHLPPTWRAQPDASCRGGSVARPALRLARPSLSSQWHTGEAHGGRARTSHSSGVGRATRNRRPRPSQALPVDNDAAPTRFEGYQSARTIITLQGACSETLLDTLPSR
jgi:hypothetical protein